MSNKTQGMTFDSSIGDRLVRSRSRILRLKQAIAEESVKKTGKSKERIVELTKELDARVKQIKEFAEGVL